MSEIIDICPLKHRKLWPYGNSLGERNNEILPRVSVIIPSFNQATFLEASIRSVLCQDYPNLECIVMDGGSNDGSIDIINHYRPALAYAQSKPDGGQSAAVNSGVSHATGQIMSFLNSDDMLAPGAIRHAVDALSANPKAMLVYGQRIMIDSNDGVAGWTSSPPFDHTTTPFTINSETAFWRHEIFTKIGGFNASLKFALDLDFFCRIYARYPIFHINEFLGYYRFHQQSKSETMDDIQQTESQNCWQKIFNEPFPRRLSALHTTQDYIRHAIMALRYPKQVAFPYLRYKLKRVRNKG